MKLSQFLIIAVLTVTGAGLAFTANWTTYTKENSGLADNEVHAICFDDLGVAWFGTKNGLSRFDGANWKSYTTTDKLAQNIVNSIAAETTSHGPEIWVATNGGVSVIGVQPDAISFATPYRKDNTGLISDMVYCAAVDTGHVKWFGTDSGATTFSGTEWKSYTNENGLNGSNIVRSVFGSSQGMVWLGSEGGGVSRFDGVTSATPYDTFYSKIASNNVYAMYISPDSTQWFGTDSGLSRHIGNSIAINWTTFTIDDGLSGNFVHAVARDIKGVIWAGTDGGVSSYDGSAWNKYTKQDGLAGNNVYAIAVDPDGSLWFGTESGVSRYSEGSVLVDDENSNIPKALSIRGSFPNPFNPQTTIEYVLPQGGFVELSLYNLSGQKIRQLVSNTLSAGMHTVVWDGCDQNGKRVSSGIYFSRLKLGSQITSGRMVLMK
jgi:ligand-binding sensor domain-containing protein